MTRSEFTALRTFAHRATRLTALPIFAIASTLLLGLPQAEAAPIKPKVLSTSWQPASSMISVSERGGIVVVPTAALDSLNDALSVPLMDASRPLEQVALPGPSVLEPELNALAIQVTTNPVSNLPADAIVTGVEVQFAFNGLGIDEKGTVLPDAVAGYSVVDDEVRFFDPGLANGTDNRAKQVELNYGDDQKFARATYGGNNDLWGAPQLPSSAAFYRGNSLFLQIKLRNQGSVPAYIHADLFRFRLHYQLPNAQNKTLSHADSAIDGLCQQAPLAANADCATVQQCYASTTSRRQVCDMALGQLLARTCAKHADLADCSEQAAVLLDATLSNRSWSIPVATAAAN